MAASAKCITPLAVLVTIHHVLVLQAARVAASRRMHHAPPEAPPPRPWKSKDQIISEEEVDGWTSREELGSCAWTNDCCVLGSHNYNEPVSGIVLGNIFGWASDPFESCWTYTQLAPGTDRERTIQQEAACPIYAMAQTSPWLGPPRCQCEFKAYCHGTSFVTGGSDNMKNDTEQACITQTHNGRACAGHPDGYKPDQWPGWQKIKALMGEMRDRYDFTLFVFWKTHKMYVDSGHHGRWNTLLANRRMAIANVRQDIRFGIEWARSLLADLEHQIFPEKTGMREAWASELKWLVDQHRWLATASGQNDWNLKQNDWEGLFLAEFTDEQAVQYADAFGIDCEQVNKLKNIRLPAYHDEVAAAQEKAEKEKKKRQQEVQKNAGGHCMPVYVMNSHWTGIPNNADQTLTIQVSLSAQRNTSHFKVYSVSERDREQWQEHGDPLLCLRGGDTAILQVSSESSRTTVSSGQVRNPFNRNEFVSSNIQQNDMQPQHLCMQLQFVEGEYQRPSGSPNFKEAGEVSEAVWVSQTGCVAKSSADLSEMYQDYKTRNCQWRGSLVTKKVGLMTRTLDVVKTKRSKLFWTKEYIEKEKNMIVELRSYKGYLINGESRMSRRRQDWCEGTLPYID